MEKTELGIEGTDSREKDKKHTQLILDSIPYRIMVVNMDMTIDTVNQSFLNEFGLNNSCAVSNLEKVQ